MSAAEIGVGDIRVRNTHPRDFERITAISKKIYPSDEPWLPEHLAAHLDVFPEGQFVAVDADDQVVGMAASLIVSWDDYDRLDSYNELTDRGYFNNHDPAGRTLYGAEVMVDPDHRRRGIGSVIYEARQDLVRRLGLLRIRAGARLPGYAAVADDLSPRQYIEDVVLGQRSDPTLSFQIRHGFRVLAVIPRYLTHDPRSRNYAALIEWLNREVASPEEAERHDRAFAQPVQNPISPDTTL